MMSPAALSILTTTFQDSDRHKALGVWAGISGLAAAVGVFFGGLLTQDFGWRWVFFVNLPLCALVLFGTFRILKADHGRSVPDRMMSPAALSILTTTFQDSDRHKALGVWAGISGLAAAVGVFFGGLLTQDFGWRWVFFVNLPLCALVLFGTFRILKADHGRSV